MIRFMQTSQTFKKYFLGAILAVICIAMAWYLVPSFSSAQFGGRGEPTLASVDGQDITVNEVQKQARQMLQQQFPNARGQAAMLLPYMTQQAAQQLINRKVLLAEGGHLGLRATDEDVREYLEHGPYAATFFPDGKFIGQQEYQDLLQQHDLTVAQFEQSVGEDIIIQKLQAVVTAPVTVTETDVKDQFEKQNTKVKFNYAVLKKDDILKSLRPTDAELKAYYDRNKQTYVNSIPEKRQIKYVVLDNAKMLAQTQVTQQELQNYYDQHRDEYRVPEQVTVRQIVVKKPLPGADGKVDQKALDAARAKADDAAKELKSGANFANVAKKYSEDTDTAKNGGLVGTVRPDVFPDPAVKSAVAATEKGQSSGVVNAGYAFVIIHVDDKQDARMKSLDEVKAQIEPLIRQQKAAQVAQNQADKLLQQARDSSLEKAAAAAGLQVISTDFVTSKDALPGIGNDQQFMNAVFAQSKNAPPDMVGLSSAYAIYEVTDVRPPATPTFEQARDQVEQQFKNERAAQLLTQKTQELADRAKNDHDLKKAAKEEGAEYKTSDFVLPDGQVPEIGSMTGGASVAFTLKPGDISGPVDAGNTGVVLSVVDRQAPTDQEFATKKDQIREQLTQQKQQEMFGLFLSNLRDSMDKSGKVKINNAQMQALTKNTEEAE